MIMSQNYKNNIPKKNNINKNKLKTSKNNISLIKKTIILMIIIIV